MEGRSRSSSLSTGSRDAGPAAPSTFDWRENGKRRTRPVGTSPREALDAWQLHSGILSGDIEPPEEEAPAASTSTTIRGAVESYLAEVKATKGDATYCREGHYRVMQGTSPDQHNLKLVCSNCGNFQEFVSQNAVARDWWSSK